MLKPLQTEGQSPFKRALALILALSTLGGVIACGEASGPQADPEVLAAARVVDKKVGETFLDYYEEVVRLAQQYSAHPDSFTVALDALPGSHLSDDEWAAWTAPHALDAEPVTVRLEEVITTLSVRR